MCWYRHFQPLIEFRNELTHLASSKVAVQALVTVGIYHDAVENLKLFSNQGFK